MGTTDGLGEGMYADGSAGLVDLPRVSVVNAPPNRLSPAHKQGDTGCTGEDRDEDAMAVILNADDFGMTPAIGVAIRRLIDMNRVSATSCLVTSPHWPGEAERLRPVAASVDVGLHFNLTFGRPLAAMPNLAPDGRFPSLVPLILRSLARRIDEEEIAAEFHRQIDRFTAEMGRLPDFVDGHQHVHALPVIRRAVVKVLARRFPARSVWLRYPALRPADIWRSPESAPGALVISLLSFGFRRFGERHGLRGNKVFRGVRRFTDEPAYPKLFERYLARLRPGTLIACHPGVHEDEVLDPRHPTAAREEEYAYLASDAFADRLRRGNVRLVRLRDLPFTVSS
ncbi:MAG: ChbG/HpnK family deacetylase [Rhodospirillales bacterium]